MSLARATVYEFGPYRLDPLGLDLKRLDESISLPRKALEVLAELLKRPGAVASKEELMAAVWPAVIVEEGNLNQMVFLLRRALGEDYIDTVPRRGYRFKAAVRATAVPRCIDSIAVLPLDNLSRDPAQDYFADGVTEALITELAKLRGLRVVSRTSVIRYRGTQETVAQIARALRVQAIVEGSVMRSGDQLRITAQLIYASTDQHLWAAGYDGSIEDIFTLQNRIARDVATIVRGELSPDEQARLTIQRRARPEAHALYLKGRFFARQLTGEGQRRALQYFQDAVQSDADYAAAYAGLAECYVKLAYFFGMEPRKAFAEAAPAALKSVQLDNSLAEGHAVLSLLRLLNDWDWSAADAESRLAIELAPGDSYVYWKRGVYLRYAGRADEAVRAHRQAESFDPFSLIAIQEVGWPLYYARRFDESIDQFRKAVELESQWDQLYFGLGFALVERGRREEAIEAARTAVRLGPDNPLNHALLVYVLGRAGEGREARVEFDRLRTTWAYIPSWFLSIVWIGLNEHERALASLEDAFRDHEPCLVSLKVDPVFDPLRHHPTFTGMLKRVGLQP
ncbi:MAG TPA: winged helix-turn-helix domain-containing protein [Steroidobacteraceae bacterium]|nr:winged helix-turn-helix domain-containing protein [Steroidobacteraceae bacterium]